MKRAVVTLCLILISSTTYAGIVDDAEKQIAKERQESLVAKAKILLEKKARIEGDLDTVKKKLSKLNDGEDVEVDDPTSRFIRLTTN